MERSTLRSFDRAAGPIGMDPLASTRRESGLTATRTKEKKKKEKKKRDKKQTQRKTAKRCNQSDHEGNNEDREEWRSRLCNHK
jgi:hypothetical protein